MVFPGTIPPKNPGSRNCPKSCPLCGSSADIGRNLRRIPSYMCICRECGYYGPNRITRRGAIRAWNRNRRKEAPDV